MLVNCSKAITQGAILERVVESDISVFCIDIFQPSLPYTPPVNWLPNRFFREFIEIEGELTKSFRGIKLFCWEYPLNRICQFHLGGKPSLRGLYMRDAGFCRLGMLKSTIIDPFLLV